MTRATGTAVTAATMSSMRVEDLIRRLQQAAPGSRFLADALKTAQGIALHGVRESFNRQTGPDGNPWRKLARPRIGGGNRILQASGSLLKSVTCTIVGNSLVLQSSHPAADVHQFGAKITPKVARALAIPLTAEAKRFGSPRGFNRPLFIVVLRNSGNAFLAERVSNGMVLHYLLRRSVTIPARPFLGFSPQTLGKIEALLEDKLMQQIYQAFNAQQSIPMRILM
jgi:phage gpG-like protein